MTMFYHADDENTTSHSTTEPGLQTIATTAFLGLIIAFGTAFFSTCLTLMHWSHCSVSLLCQEEEKSTEYS